MVARPNKPDDNAKLKDVSDTEDEFELGWDEGIHVVTPEEGQKLFDQWARQELGISGEEFLRRYDNGDYKDVPDTPEGWKVMRMVMALPFARPTSF